MIVMQQNFHKRFLETVSSAAFTARAVGGLFFSTSLTAFAQNGSSDGEWPSYAADAGSTKYTSLSQINADNFAELDIAWRWSSIDAELDFEALLGPDADISFGRLQATPLMVDGVIYMLTALNQVAALDAVSGEMLWSHDPEVYMSGEPISPLGFHHRGVAWFSRRRYPSTHADLGQHARRRLERRAGAAVVAGTLPRHGDHHHRARVQPVRRRNSRCSRPAFAWISLDSLGTIGLIGIAKRKRYSRESYFNLLN